MSSLSLDPELMQDFLTESGELLEQLDQDLIKLESTPTDPELLNQVFRALHTIKGSASFLALTNLVAIAHAAESALNAARNRVITVDRTMMDGLLAAVDILKRQFDDIRANAELTLAPQTLVDVLAAYGEGKVPGGAAPAPTGHDAATGVAAAARQAAPSATPADSANSGGDRVLDLPPGKAELLDYLISDLNATLEQVEAGIRSLAIDGSGSPVAGQLAEQCAALSRSVDFFDFDAMNKVVCSLGEFAKAAGNAAEDQLKGMSRGAEQAIAMLRKQSAGLSDKKLIDLPVDAFLAEFQLAISGKGVMSPGPAPANAPASVPVLGSAQSAATAAAASTSRAEQETAHPDTPTPGTRPANEPADHHAGHADGAHPGEPAAIAPAAKEHGKEHAKDGGADQTIRVEVGRLESLLNLVGELVLQKNRVSSLSRQLAVHDSTPQEMRESFIQAYGSLDRVTSELQAAVMKTRMQPLEKIFGKYPRIIRDLSRKLGKQINLVIEGGDTEVDKSVIEELGDPLVHLIRNSCDHGIELPAERVASGKEEVGTVKLRACHRGSHVQILITDDGKGLGKQRIIAKALEKGLYTQEQIAAMSEKDIFRIIFAAGFSTAAVISDVSGRGVGMDVVRTNIEKLKGTIELYSEEGKGTTIEILIPLTVAIMAAMMVGVGDEIYAVPLSNIVEIVRPEAAQLGSITQRPVLRLRDRVLPLISAAELFTVPAHKAGEAPFAVVLELSDKKIGLLVDRLIGQQEIVIKPLSEMLDRGGPVSGATVRDDGGVSLIVDIARLFQIAEQRTGRG